MMGFDNIHQMNSLKSTLGTLINLIAVTVFVIGKQVYWPFAIAMAISAAIGGYFGASIARRLDKRFVRNAVVVIGFSLAAYYFYRQWSGLYRGGETLSPKAASVSSTPSHLPGRITS